MSRPATILVWLQAMRAPFFQAVIVPCVLGTVVAWHVTGQFHPGYFLLALVGVVCVNAGTNLANDYFDHRTGADELNTEHTIFSGGSRVIQDGLLTPATVFRAAIGFFAAACVIGLYLVYIRGWLLLGIGFIGVASGYFYTATPAKLGYRGFGELIAGLNCGPLVVLGAYFVQAQTVSRQALIVALPVGALITAILYINQFSDCEADRKANKNHLVAILGPEKSLPGYYLLLGAAYVVIILGCALNAMPPLAAIALASAPVAFWAARSARNNCLSGSGRKLVPAMAGTVICHLLTGVLLTCGYLLTGTMSNA